MVENQRLQRQFDGLLLMDIVMPEICWAVSVRQNNKILRLIVASSWVFYLSDWRCTEPQILKSSLPCSQSLPPLRILSQMYPVYALPSWVFRTHSHISLSRVTGSEFVNVTLINFWMSKSKTRMFNPIHMSTFGQSFTRLYTVTSKHRIISLHMATLTL